MTSTTHGPTQWQQPPLHQIRSWHAAEINAAAWMRHWGYADATVTNGGADGGIAVFTYAELAFAAWSAALLVIGIRAVNGWSWTRAVVAACAAASPIAVGAALLRFETAVA